MAAIDIFENDAFGVMSITASINENPEGQKVPTVMNELFQEEGVISPIVSIEKDGDSLALVPAKERGDPGTAFEKASRDLIPFKTIHLPQAGGIDADEVMGVREFGTETEVQQMSRVVGRELMRMRRRLDATIAYQRICAVKGKIYDADGSTLLLDVFAHFGLVQQSLNMLLTTGSTKVKTKVLEAIHKSEDAMGDSEMVMGYRVLCGRNFFKSLVSHADVEKAFDRWQEGAFLRTNSRPGFDFAGAVWQEYYGKVGGIEFINTDEAYLMPIGVNDLFMTSFAPANYIETVGSVGVPYYAKQELRKFGKGIDIEAQSNPLNICTRPRTVIKLTRS